ncbi:MAG: DUF2059 domain-containing protein [Chitinophagaceae bacterium]|nr:DUF2059 domain-containing protein [Chitinophagaceae bacterium]
MKKLLLLSAILISSNLVFSQTTASKENVRKLLEMTGSGNLGALLMQKMIADLRKLRPNIPAEFWDGLVKEVNPESLVDNVVPVYMKYYSNEEILKLIEFYNTPLGKKVIANTPLITQESYMIGKEWGKQIATQILKQIKEKGYETGKEAAAPHNTELLK